MLKYKGNGKFIPGVPARDLVDEEVKRFGKSRLLASGLYQETKQKRVTPAAPDYERAKE